MKRSTRFSFARGEVPLLTNTQGIFQMDKRLDFIINQQPFPLMFVTVSGAHLYGFPSPDSDYDLRGVHLLPLRDIVGLERTQETVEQSVVHEGLEIDLVTHDAQKFFLMLLKRNGYVLEQLLSPLVLRTSPAFNELRSLAPGCITRHHAHHYLGFAKTQWGLFSKEEVRRIKPLLYTFRVLLTGVHLMRSGEVEANLLRLSGEYGLSYIPDLVRRKLEGKEKSTIENADMAFFESEYLRLTAMLEQAQTETKLPEEPTSRAALNELLVRMRLGY